MTITYDYGDALYLNLTNRCTCDCVFCLRRYADGVTDGQSLWLEHEPSLEEIEAAINAVRLDRYSEAVFCGFGEPTQRLDMLIHTAQWIKAKSSLPIRLNTNGLSDLINQKETAPLLATVVDRISISLNAPDAQTYDALCHPVFANNAYDAIIQFALACKKTSMEVCLSVVGHALSRTQLAQCKDLCQSLGVRLKVR
jgi:TatD family-associated radical SAM protein